jgi:hypothetical protein
MNNKDLITQYVDTGLKLPEYQVMQLSNNDKKTYIRKRLIGTINTRTSILSDYEESLITDENDKKKYNDFKSEYIMKKLNNGERFEKHEFDILADDLKPEYVMGLLKWETYCLKDYEFKFLPSRNKVAYLLDGNDCGQEHFDLYYNTLSGKDKFDYYSDIISVWDLKSLSNKEQQEYEQLKNIYD